MEDKKLEKILQEKADNIKMRDFSEVWEEIKGEIVEQEPEKKKNFFQRRWLSLSLAAIVLVVAVVLVPLIFRTPRVPGEEVFYADKLSSHVCSVDETLNGLSQENINHVDLSKFIITDSALYLTEKNEVKGANLTIYDKNYSKYYAMIKIYDKNVNLSIDMTIYNELTKVNSVDVQYRYIGISSDLYKYDAYAVCNGVKYVIEYSGLSDNFTEFLNDFFG